MRWMAVALLLCALPLAAQSLGDVARMQRDDAKRTQARHVITNDDLSSATQPLPSPPATTPPPLSKPIDRGQQADVERAREQQRHIAELNQRLQLLQNEVSDLEKQRTSVRNSNVYGDPNRIQKNDEIRNLSGQIESKSREVAAARNELTEAIERANKATVLK